MKMFRNDLRREWLEYLKNRLEFLEKIFGWILVGLGIALPILMSQLFLIVGTEIIIPSGLNLSALQITRAIILLVFIIALFVIAWIVSKRAHIMRRRIMRIILQILNGELREPIEIGEAFQKTKYMDMRLVLSSSWN
jgi:ABC-type multidrug transport system fused ATPase/permease subunit